SLARTVASKNGFPLLAVGCSGARKSVPDIRTCAVIGPFLSPFLQLRSKRPLPGHRRHLLRKIMNKTIAATVNDPSTKMRGLSIGIFPVCGQVAGVDGKKNFAGTMRVVGYG